MFNLLLNSSEFLILLPYFYSSRISTWFISKSALSFKKLLALTKFFKFSLSEHWFLKVVPKMSYLEPLGLFLFSVSTIVSFLTLSMEYHTVCLKNYRNDET